MKLSEAKNFQSQPEFGWLIVVILVGVTSFLVGQNIQTQTVTDEVAPTSDVSPEAKENTVVGEISKQIESKSINTSDQTSISSLIDINRAGIDELDTLPGIGPAYAERIVEYRNENGSFTSLDELTNVKGIGPKTLEKIRDKITL